MARKNTSIAERYKPFVQEIEAASGTRRAGDVFFDSVRMMALAIQRPFMLEGGEDVEAEWRRFRDLYTDEEYGHIVAAFDELMCALEECRDEFLGHVMESCFEVTNQHAGQFLTPVNVSSMMAKMLSAPPPPRDEIVSLNDPCCGAGVLLIQGAEELLKQGWKQRNIYVEAGDIDIHALDMCYVQLSLLGYAACVKHQDALTQKTFSPARFTPGYYIHCFPMRTLRGVDDDFRDRACGRASEVECPDGPVVGPPVGQGATNSRNGHAPSGPEGAPSSNETGKPVQMELELN